MKRVSVVVVFLFLVSTLVFADFSMSGEAKAEYTYSTDYEISSSIDFTLKPRKGVTIVIPFSAKDGTEYEMGKIKFNFKLDKIRYTIIVDPSDAEITDSKLTGDKWSVDLVKGYMYGEYAVSSWDYVYDEITEDFRAVLFNNTTGKKKKKDGMTFRLYDYSLGLSKDDLCFQTALIKMGDFTFRSSVIAQVMDGSGSNNRSFSASADYSPEEFEFYAAFDSRKTKTLNYDAVIRFSSDLLDIEWYYASKTTRPSGSDAYKEYMSFLCSFELDDLKFHLGMKDLLKNNMMQSLCAGAAYDNDSVDFDASAIYNFDEKILVLGYNLVLIDIDPEISLTTGANLWTCDGENILTGKLGSGCYTDDFDITMEILMLKQTDMPLYLGFSANASFYTLVEDVRVEASFTVDPNNAARLTSIANWGRRSYSDNMPFTYFDGHSTLSVSCTYTF